MKMTKRFVKAMVLVAAVFFLCASGRDVYAGGDSLVWANGTTKDVTTESTSTGYGKTELIESWQWMKFRNTSSQVLDFEVTVKQTAGSTASWALLNYTLNSLDYQYRAKTYSENCPYGDNRRVHISPGEMAMIYVKGSTGARFTFSITLNNPVEFGMHVPGDGTGLGDTANLTLKPDDEISGASFMKGDADTLSRTSYKYKFTTTKKIYLTMQDSYGFSKVWLDSETVDHTIINYSKAQKTIAVSAGSHTLFVQPKAADSVVYRYFILYSISDDIPATDVSFTSLPASAAKGQKINITAQTVPANSSHKISWIAVDGKKLTIPTGQNTVTVPYTISCNGYIDVEVYTDNSIYKKTKVYIAPDTPALNYSSFSTTHNTVTYSKPNNYQAQIMIGGRWVNYTGSQGGLAANTAYPVRVRAFAGSPVGTLYSAWSAPVTLRTNTNVLPGFKSVKISKAKVKKKKVWINGYWKKDLNRYIWVKGYYTTRYTTSYKVTVKLKKAPGAAGMIVNGTRFPGNKKTYTYNITEQGKRKGKKATLVIGFYNNTGWNNQSITKTYKVKIK